MAHLTPPSHSFLVSLSSNQFCSTGCCYRSMKRNRRPSIVPLLCFLLRWCMFAEARPVYIRFVSFVSSPSWVTVPTNPQLSVNLTYGEPTKYLSTDLGCQYGCSFNLTFNGQLISATFDAPDYDRYTVVLAPATPSTLVLVQVFNDLTWQQTTYNITSPYSVNTLFRLVYLPLQTSVVTWYSRSHNCIECGYLPVNVNYSTGYKLDNSIGGKDIQVQVEQGGETVVRDVAKDANFDSQGIYTLFYDSSSGKLIKAVDQEPEPFWGALSFLLAYLLLVAACRTSYKKWAKGKPRYHFRERRSLRTKRTEETLRYNRIDALDTLRGLAILSLLFFRAGGGNFTFFNESLWEGFTYGDLPEFIIAWIMGFSIPLAYKNQVLFARPKFQNFKSVVLRGILIIFAGMVTNRNQNLESMIPSGFLQHLGIGYTLIGTLYLVFPTQRISDRRRSTKQNQPKTPTLTPKRKPSEDETEDWSKRETLSLGFSNSDKGSAHFIKMSKRHAFLPYFNQWNTRIRTIVMISLAVANYLTFKTVSAPGCPAGYANPGGISDHSKYTNCTGGLLGYVDFQVLGIHHIPVEPACKYLYQCPAFSRYSIMSIPNFLLVVYLGLMAGETTLCYRRRKARLSFILFIAIFCCLATIGLTAVPGPQTIQLNKGMWSISFVLLANVFTSLVYFFIKLLFDQRLVSGWPFKAAGLNTFALLLTSGIVGDRFPLGFENSGGHIMMLCSNLLCVTVWASLALVLHRYRF